MRYDESHKTGLGHICTGGGAKIVNSPIEIHIHIHTNSEPLINKVGRILNGIIGKRHIALEQSERLTEVELQGRIVQQLEG